jgi:hypothetical protein
MNQNIHEYITRSIKVYGRSEDNSISSHPVGEVPTKRSSDQASIIRQYRTFCTRCVQNQMHWAKYLNNSAR